MDIHLTTFSFQLENSMVGHSVWCNANAEMCVSEWTMNFVQKGKVNARVLRTWFGLLGSVSWSTWISACEKKHRIRSCLGLWGSASWGWNHGQTLITYITEEGYEEGKMK
jgi:hypothetical protein